MVIFSKKNLEKLIAELVEKKIKVIEIDLTELVTKIHARNNRMHEEHSKQVESYLKGFNEILEKLEKKS